MFTIHLTASQVDVSLLLLLLLGFGVGLLTGLLGVGGGWLITPALNIMGVPISYAVGSGLAQMTGTSLLSILKHRKHGNTDFKMGLTIGIPMILGVQIGKSILMHFEKLGNASQFTGIMYIVLLGFMGVSMLKEFIAPKKALETEHKGIGNKLKSFLEVGPKIKLEASKTESSWIFLIVLGVFAGVLSGIMGVGGGFLLMPVMTYLIGAPTIVAVGTSLICVFISGISGTVAFSLDGRVDWMAAGIVFGGSFIGSNLGVAATKYIQGKGLRFMFALLVNIAAVSVFLQQLGYNTAATVLIFGATGLLCVVALSILTKGYLKNR